MSELGPVTFLGADEVREMSETAAEHSSRSGFRCLHVTSLPACCCHPSLLPSCLALPLESLEA